MNEYLTDAIVLGREDLNEFDSRVDLYTKNYGRLRAKAKSIRKSTSKLAGHLEPLMLSRVRLVDKNDILVVDSLTIDRFEFLRSSPKSFQSGLQLLGFFRQNILEGEQDPALWNWLKSVLISGKISYADLSKRLGF